MLPRAYLLLLPEKQFIICAVKVTDIKITTKVRLVSALSIRIPVNNFDYFRAENMKLFK